MKIVVVETLAEGVVSRMVWHGMAWHGRNELSDYKECMLMVMGK